MQHEYQWPRRYAQFEYSLNKWRLRDKEMDDKTKLIESLQINREQELPERSSRGGLWVGIAIAVVAIAGAGWWWSSRDAGVVARAEAASSVSAAAEPVAVASSGSRLDASGYVVARRSASVSAAINGRVVEVLISEGSSVKQGEVVARLDDSLYRLQLNQAKANLESANSRLRAARLAQSNAEPIYQRAQKQRAAGYLSAEELDRAKISFDNANSELDVQRQVVAVSEAAVAIAERNLTETVVRAPFAGIITAKNAQPGEVVSPSAAGGSIRTGIGTIVDMDSLEVEVDVSENFINRVQAGQPATVKLNAYPDWEIPAQVIAVIPTAERAKATVKVRIGFKQKDPRILPEMGARVAFLEGKT